MNTTLDQDESEFGVLVLSVDFEMFSNGDGFFDEMPKIFGDSRGETYPSTTNVISGVDGEYGDE